MYCRNCAGPEGSNVNRKPIRYGFRDAPIIDPVTCEHGLRPKPVSYRLIQVLKACPSFLFKVPPST